LGRAFIGTSFFLWDFSHYAIGCVHGCCGFFQNAYRSDLGEQYADALVKEMDLTASAFFVEAHPFQAIYFGGGTPTALPEE
jgi:coproporphyrinogen III oxidase-like Fe-S oxidoreductase